MFLLIFGFYKIQQNFINTWIQIGKNKQLELRPRNLFSAHFLTSTVHLSDLSQFVHVICLPRKLG